MLLNQVALSIYIQLLACLQVIRAIRVFEIAIADTGSGIPPDNLDKLFDPFLLQRR